jgi:hypothetical protein
MPQPFTKSLPFAAALLVAVLPLCSQSPAPAVQIGRMLDSWHQAAASADEPAYFAHFAPNGVFMGTDAAERWTVPQFRDYAHPFFARGRAWSFKPRDRHIDLSADGRTAWFDEMLDTPNLGVCRGSGVVVLSGSEWKIAQYNLSIAIPNALANDIVKQIGKTAAK